MTTMDEQMALDHTKDIRAQGMFDDASIALTKIVRGDGHRLNAKDLSVLGEAAGILARRSDHITAVWD